MDRIQLIQAFLIKADALYQSGKTAVEIASLAEIWLPLVADIGDGLLREAMDHHFKHGLYFPKPADIVSLADQIAAAKPQGEECLALPETHPADKNPAMAMILKRAGQMRVASEKSRRPLSFSEAFERAKSEVNNGAHND